MLFLQLVSLLIITCNVPVFYVINKHVLAMNVCYYSFCNEILMIHVFFSKVQIFSKRYFTIYVIFDFTPYEKNVSFQCTGDVVYLIPLKKTIPGIPIDVVAVNYAVFAISIFINYYL
jgi:hypothetical protein